MSSNLSLLPFFFILFFLVLSQVKCKFDNAQTTSSFEFIKELQGHEKGSKAQGLHDLKLYLARFGYLNYHPTPTPNHENHHFDQDLENALKSYQNFHNLDATGTLDEATVSQMAKPRCGNPDIKADHQHNTNPLHFKSHYKLIPCINRWPSNKTNLTYAINVTVPSEHTYLLVRAFSTWDSASKYFTFTRVDDYEGADLKVSMEDGNVPPFLGSGALAFGNPPTDGRLLYNSLVNWTVGPELDVAAVDVGSTFLHEIGHLLGLDHSQDPHAVMWPYLGTATILGLGTDDIVGLDVLYNHCNDAVSPPPTPLL